MTSERPPSVDRLARSLESSGLPHAVCVEVARQAIAEDRVHQASDMARHRSRRLIIPVINATGTLLHTNLGRAPIHLDSRASYSNVELNLATGERGSRQSAIGASAALACGAEAAMVVNNCASALLLVLAALARGRGAAVSRGELVEIGGAFRVPDVMRQSGAQLVEVGTTNRTRIDDFARAFTVADIALVLSVHQSNYTITGFSEQTAIGELATLGVPVVADIGSGLLDSACPWLEGPPPPWLQDEPAARQTLEAGADLVMFSGDKLLGGPQAGIIAGRADLVAACRSHPLARALRPGGLVLEALQETLLSYLRRDGAAIPFWRMAHTPVEELVERAQSVVHAIGSEAVHLQRTHAVPGGGTLPGRRIPSAGVQCDGDVAGFLRDRDLPIVGRIQDGATICDLRTVDPEDDNEVVAALREAVGALR
jgi:L-seryl-tRNA(Ser) seleniumtransferase